MFLINRDVGQSTSRGLVGKVLPAQLYPNTLVVGGTVITVSALSAPVPILLAVSAQMVALVYGIALLGLTFRTK